MDTTALGTSLLDEAPPPVARRRPAVPALCQPGVALRALLFVQGVACLGAGVVAPGPAAWLQASAVAAAVAVPATLAWLVVACAARAAIVRLGAAGALLAMSALGGLAAALAWWPLHAIGLAGASAAAGGPVAAAGAAFGGVMYHWLQLRARATLPAATEARLAELQSRIRPHFLFNTLNAAITLVRVDPARAEEMLEDLAELFRAALTAPDAESTLADEFRLARMYLGIEAQRFGQRLQVEWDIADDVQQARVPPLTLQPLLENAVHHGIEPGEAGGLIQIRARVRRGRAWVQVLNTVGGPATPGHGIGLASVRERLRLMHDLDADFDAGPQPDGRYRVRLSVPLNAA